MSALSPRLDRPVALVGLPGAGKSSAGRRLAALLSLPFRDGDEEVERAAGTTIPAIFARGGEPAFRALERQALDRLAAGPPAVIATGGGAFAEPETRALLLARCVTVWLEIEPREAAARIGHGSRRPLLAGRDPADALRELADRRELLYAEAHLRVPAGGGDADAVAGRVLQALGRYPG